MQLYRCIQIHNSLLPINLYIMVVNNEYNSHIVFDGKTKRCATFYKLSSQVTLSFLCLFVILFFNNIYPISDPSLYESSELKILIIQIIK